jgi:hypothetical protein
VDWRPPDSPCLFLHLFFSQQFRPVRPAIGDVSGHSVVDESPVTGISPRQLKAIWALSHRVGLDDRELHALVAARTGRVSLRELRRSEAATVIDELLAKVSGRAPAPRKPGAVTRAQQALLARLADELEWPPERLPALVRRMYGTHALRELTVKQASGLIEALKAMLGRRGRAA